MANYITVDGGTTNTRVSLIADGEVLGVERLSLGARVGIDDKNAQREAIRDAVRRLLANARMTEGDIARILASGMITSEFGLIKLDHICAPAGIEELHGSMHECVMEDISTIPFVFVRGVRTVSEELSECDIMRGEETELMGLSPEGECVYILPGSHSKIIYTDECARIKSFYTMLTGEMIYALSSSTILKDAVDLTVKNTDREYLLRGYEYAVREGLNEALFKVRILKNVFSATREQIYSFFLGAVLSGEVKKIIALEPRRIVIAGKEQLKDALYTLLCESSDAELIKVSSDTIDRSVSDGVIRIYEYSAEK